MSHPVVFAPPHFVSLHGFLHDVFGRTSKMASDSLTHTKPFNSRKQFAQLFPALPLQPGQLVCDMGPRREHFWLRYYQDELLDRDVRNAVDEALDKLKTEYKFKLVETDPVLLAKHWSNIHQKEDQVLQSLRLPTGDPRVRFEREALEGE